MGTPGYIAASSKQLKIQPVPKRMPNWATISLANWKGKLGATALIIYLSNILTNVD